ncbi:MAG: EamA family transporter RarD [Acidobacteria bacterium]|nr:EamA family transporter RarD [Acidobacteriota bacterium]
MPSKGILHAFGAYFIWGLVPIYWKLLKHVPAIQLIGHRIVWSFMLLIILLFVMRKWPELRKAVSSPRIFLIYFAAAVLCGFNWFIYVWGVTAGYIVECSLGYFINPLLSVLLGVLFLGERLRLFQWISIGLAAAGVIYLTLVYGRLPWIALGLAFTFGFYGLVKKTAPLNSLNGLTLETGILFLPGLLFLLHQDAVGLGAFSHVGLGSDLLMAGAGLITTVPLLMFASAAQRIPLTTIGIMHYITPTLQLLLGVLVYKEAFSADRAVGFGVVCIGLIVFCVESFVSRRAAPVKPLPELS